VLVTSEMQGIIGPEIRSPVPDLSSVVDNILVLRFVEYASELKRMMTILKVRDSLYDPSLFEVVIGAQGLAFTKAFKQAEAVLTGSASPRSH